MGGYFSGYKSMERYPPATFDFRPDEDSAKYKSQRITVEFELRYENNEFIWLPEKFNFSKLIEGYNVTNNKMFILRSVTPTGSKNGTNFNTSVIFKMSNYEEDINECTMFESEIKANSSTMESLDPIFEHPFPDCLQLYSYLVYKTQLLNPKYKNATEKSVYRFIETNTPFYKVYRDSINGFAKYLEEREHTKTIEYEIVKSTDGHDLTESWVRINAKAMDKFIEWLKLRIFDNLKFVDCEKTYVTIKSLQESISNEDIKIFKSQAFQKYGTEQKVPILTAFFTFDISYIAVKKNTDYERKSVINELFKKVKMENESFDISTPIFLKQHAGVTSNILFDDVPKKVDIGKVVEKITGEGFKEEINK